MPDIRDDRTLKFPVLVWLNKWEERFRGWIKHPELETHSRMIAINQLLARWNTLELEMIFNTERGCPAWCIEQGIWTENRSAGYSKELQRHQLQEEI
jgi:hypothetical protein